MQATGKDCGALYTIYAAARDGDHEAVRNAWREADPILERLDPDEVDPLEDAVSAGELDRVQSRAAELLFVDAESPALDGWASRLVGLLLHGFGYLASFVLFFRAHSAETVVPRLRWAYRTVGVDIRDTETVGDIERTTFRCPYRNLGAERYGQRRVCHDVLDRVDDGYVTFLDRHRDIDYQRPRACTASECCYSEVAER